MSYPDRERIEPTMIRSVPLLSLLGLLLPSTAWPAGLEWPVWRAAAMARPVPAYRGDRLSLHLDAATARAVRLAAHGLPASRVGVASLDRALAALGARVRPEFRGETSPPAGSSQTDFTTFFLVDLPPGADLESALGRFRGLPEVSDASPIGVAPVAAVPNDSLWAGSWWFYQPSRRDIHAPEAWDLTRGDSSVVVALIDTGLIPYHPDIGGLVAGERGLIWTNWAEASGTLGVDDDGNGFVDDEWGWDFVALGDSAGVTAGEDWRDEDDDPNDFVGHGTTVAGLIGALTDNRIGIAGTAWNVRIMPLRVGWSMRERQTGVVDMSYVAQAVRYATRMGARVINISLSTLPLLELTRGVEAAIGAGVTVVVASGNNGSPNGLNDQPGLIHVTATDRNDVIPRWANLGSWVDFAAPGADVATTVLTRTGTDSISLRQPGYVSGANGTSFAAPIVSGAVALVQSRRLAQGLPLLPPEAVRLRLVAACDDISAQNPDLLPIYYGAGRLNAAAALEQADAHVTGLGATVVGAPVSFATADGRPRVAVATRQGELVILDGATLSVLGRHPMGGVPRGDIAAADLGDGRLGFFAAIGDSAIGGFGGGGAPLPGWPVAISPGTLTPPTLGDLDGDGSLEVVSVGPRDATSAWGAVWAWNLDGTVHGGFPATIGRATQRRPALGDLDGVPGLEVVATDADNYGHAIRGDGSALPGWPVWIQGSAAASPVITRWPSGPLVVFLSSRDWYGYSTPGRLEILYHLASVVSPMEPATADLDRDGTDEVVVATTNFILPWRLSPGAAPSWSVPLGGGPIASPVVGHLASGDSLEVLLPTPGAPIVVTSSGARRPEFGAWTPFGPEPTLAPPLSGTSTIVYDGVAPYDYFQAFAAAAGSWSPTPQPWPTSRGNFARTGSRWDAPPMGIPDADPPAAVTDLRGEALGPTSVRLTWHAPIETGGPTRRAHEYDLRLSNAPIADEAFATCPRLPVPRPPAQGGTEETLLVAVPVGQAAFLRLRARDDSGNWSGPSNESVVTTPGRAPDRVTDLRVEAASESTLALRWSATGEDGWIGRPARYEIRVSPREMAPSEFERAPFTFARDASADAGAAESTVAGPLTTDTRYWVALRAVDHEGFRSAFSNVADQWTLPVGPHFVDETAPSAITDLLAEGLDARSTRLVWTAPSDDAPLGRAVEYQLRKALEPIDADDFTDPPSDVLPGFPGAAGAAETTVVAPPAGPIQYYALRARDAAGHWSAPSNVAVVRVPATESERLSLAVLGNPSTPPIALAWSAAAAAAPGRGRLLFRDVAGRRVRSFDLGLGTSGVLTWDGNDQDGRRLPAGLYFAELSTPAGKLVRRIALLP